MKRVLFVVALIAAAGAAYVFRASAVQPASGGRLTIEQLIDIRHPSNPMWSPDGRSVVFVSDRAGVSKVYVADAGGGSTKPRELPEAGASLAGAFWSADGRALMLVKNGDLWRVPIDGSAGAAVWTTPQTESAVVPSPDASRVAFVRAQATSAAAQPSAPPARGRGAAGASGNELWTRSVKDGRESLVARSDDGAISGISWSPDGASLVFT